MKSPEYFNFEKTQEKPITSPEDTEKIVEIDGPILKLEQAGSYKQKGFDLNRELESAKGPLIEVAGPTEEGFEFIEMSKLPKDISVSNLHPGAPTFDRQTGKFYKYYGQVDFQADGRNLPLEDKTAGAIFIKAIGNIRLPDGNLSKKLNDRQLKEEVIKEAYRVLEDEGIFVLEMIEKDFFNYAQKLGFEVKQYKIKEQGMANFVFKKPPF